MTQTIIVTGCAKRIGLGIVSFYLKNSDYKVIGVVRNISSELKNLKSMYPQKIELIIKDLDNELLDTHFFKEIIDTHGELKGFIHCASKLLIDTLETVLDEDFLSQRRIHYTLFNEALLAYLEIAKTNNLKTIPCFINFGDYKVSNGKNVGFSYGQSKFLAINSIKEQAQNALGYARVNAVSPGYTLPTEGYVENFKEIIDGFPFKYTSDIQDICDTIDFFIKQKSITGQHIAVDAGAGLVK